MVLEQCIQSENERQTATKRTRNSQRASYAPIDKESITISIPSEIVEVMEEARFNACKTLPKHKKKKLTKSMIYGLALEAIAENYQSGKEKSALWLIIRDWAKEDAE